MQFSEWDGELVLYIDVHMIKSYSGHSSFNACNCKYAADGCSCFYYFILG
jgi:hypothetical protein